MEGTVAKIASESYATDVLYMGIHAHDAIRSLVIIAAE